LPGLYVQPDTGLAVALDNVRVEELSHTGKTVKFRLTNPTKFAADVSVLVESAKAAKQSVGSFVLKPLPVVHLDAGATTTLEYTASSSSRN
jgi:P pilus assembly chaperone PapD